MSEGGTAAADVPQESARPTDPFAVAALVAALTPAFCLLGIVFGHIAHRRIRRSGDKGWGLATAGLVVGYAALVITVGAVVAFWALLRAAVDPDSTGSTAPTADPTATVFTLATTNDDLPDAVVESAATYLSERLAVAGVAAAAEARDHKIIVTFDSPPGDGVLALLTGASDVTFRPVLWVDDPSPSEAFTVSPTDRAGPDSPSDFEYYFTSDVAVAFASADCRDPGQTPFASPEGALVACATTGDAKYALGPVEVQGENIAGLTADPNASTSGTVTNEVALTLAFDSAGTTTFRDATARLSGLPTPSNQFAIVLDGSVVSAPAVNGVIASGECVISGSGDDEMYDLAGRLGYGRASHDWHVTATN